MVIGRRVVAVLIGLAAVFSAGESAQRRLRISADLQPQTLLTTKQPFWVIDRVGEPIHTACYRKAYITKKCPRGYDSEELGTCWAQCPFEYPVECGMECLPQNDRCSKEVLRKVGSTVTAAMNLVSAGVFGQLVSASKAVKQGFDCSSKVLPVVEHIVDFVHQQGDVVDTSFIGQIKIALAQKSFVTTDLPAAVSACLGLDLPTPSAEVMHIVDVIVDVAVDTLANGDNPVSTENFLKLLQAAGLAEDQHRRLRSELTFDDAKQLMELGVTCGSNVKRVIDGIVQTVQTIKKGDLNATADSIRFIVMNSELFLKDLPDTVVQCVNATTPEAFKTRDKILAAVHTIVDKVLDSAMDKGGKPMTVSDYAIKIADLGLEALSSFDPTGLAALTKEFVQPICGPTIFVEPIDSGPAEKAVGLRTVDRAFEGSSGEWKASALTAERWVKVSFTSKDDMEVTVQIKSGGNDLHEVKVAAGKTVQWSAPLTDVHGKTLYMTRSRPGFLGIKGKSGGSLLLWVPEVGTHGSEDLTLNVNINPPSGEEEADTLATGSNTGATDAMAIDADLFAADPALLPTAEHVDTQAFQAMRANSGGVQTNGNRPRAAAIEPAFMAASSATTDSGNVDGNANQPGAVVHPMVLSVDDGDDVLADLHASQSVGSNSGSVDGNANQPSAVIHATVLSVDHSEDVLADVHASQAVGSNSGGTDRAALKQEQKIEAILLSVDETDGEQGAASSTGSTSGMALNGASTGVVEPGLLSPSHNNLGAGAGLFLGPAINQFSLLTVPDTNAGSLPDSNSSSGDGLIDERCDVEED